MKVIVIGGGAAGFFAAINIAEKEPSSEVIILEKTEKLLQKVKVSGGGRCNVTNARTKPAALTPFYPRGNKKLHGVFKAFATGDMVAWLERHGVETKSEEDLRMFPVTDSSQTIIDCFLACAKKYLVSIKKSQGVTALNLQNDDRWLVKTSNQEYLADKVVFASGSSPAAWNLLSEVGLKITPIVPSLFTFKIKDNRLQDLQGIAFQSADIKVVGTKLTESGPLLITHQGLSGPVVLKLSSWGAYQLHEKGYQFEVLINFTGVSKPEQVREQILNYKKEHPLRKVVNYPLFDLPKRFWERIVHYCEIPAETTYAATSKKQMNKLVEELAQGKYRVNGKNTFKEEFVTAGGVSLNEIDLKTFECKRFPGLFLAGEVLDIDALTGGFNFQACWSAGWIISESIASKVEK